MEVVEEALRRAENDLGAFLSLEPEAALEAARQVDADPDPGPLAGVPVAIKDNILVAGLPCTCASRMLEGYRAPYTATVVERLLAKGAVPLGRTNMDEFAMGSSTETSCRFPTRNPWDPERVPGGSSGGSAVAVAAGITPIALGSETGGSVRQPASLCGVVGAKPTTGRVSRHGLVAFASSTDQVAAFGATVRDAALAVEAISGHDPRDLTTANRPVPDLLAACDRPVHGLTIGLPTEFWAQDVDARVHDRVMEAVHALEARGTRVVELSIPSLSAAVAVYQVLASAEASSNLARFDGVRYGPREPASTLVELYRRTRSRRFGEEVQRRILLGTFVLSEGWADRYYAVATRVRDRMCRELAQAFEAVDVLVSPTSPTVAFRLGERTADPLSMYRSDAFVIPASLAGLPAVSVPCGLARPRDGGPELPVGLQVMAAAWNDETCFQLAAAVEAQVGVLRPQGVERSQASKRW